MRSCEVIRDSFSGPDQMARESSIPPHALGETRNPNRRRIGLLPGLGPDARQRT